MKTETAKLRTEAKEAAAIGAITAGQRDGCLRAASLIREPERTDFLHPFTDERTPIADPYYAALDLRREIARRVFVKRCAHAWVPLSLGDGEVCPRGKRCAHCGVIVHPYLRPPFEPR